MIWQNDRRLKPSIYSLIQIQRFIQPRKTIGIAVGVLAFGSSIIFMPIVLPVQAQTSTAQEMTALKRSTGRWIEVNLSRQRLTAWEGRTPVYAVIISTGTAEDPTLPGVFTIQSKHRQARMQGDDYDISDVPYTMYYDGSYAIHGAYWHRRFGTPVSHGCVNVAVDHARWLFNWASVGTPVVVHR